MVIFLYHEYNWWIHRVVDILLGFEPKDAGSIPAGSVYSSKLCKTFEGMPVLPELNFIRCRND